MDSRLRGNDVETLNDDETSLDESLGNYILDSHAVLLILVGMLAH